MFYHLTLLSALIAAALAGYGLVLLFTRRKNIRYNKKLTPSFSLNQTSATAFPPELIDRPLYDFNEDTSITLTRDVAYPEPKLEIVDDEDNNLLKTAEVVVEKIQDAVSLASSKTTTAEEIYRKIKSIVSQYGIFHNTEYFDAINSFIAITVERDCAVQLSKEQLLQLWQ